MHFTELPRQEPSPRSVAISEVIFPRRAGVKGSISRPEARFLMTAIEAVDAKTVLELGVASGGSTLYMLAMLKELPGPRKLFAFDLEEAYYGDPSRRVGYLALESEFNVDDRLVVRGGIFSADLRTAIGAGTAIDLAFIDGNHQHPWATIDLLFILPLMREGGIVAFHDINLPLVTGASKGYGPMKVFSRPFESRFVVPGDQPNIGAMRVVDKAKMIDLAIEALGEAWETRLSAELADRIVAEIQSGPLASHAAELAPYFKT